MNKFIGIGRLGRDSELTHSSSGVAICKFSIAISEKKKNKTSGQYEEFTEWVNITTFGKTAENCGKFLSKGSQCAVEGKVQTDSYEKNDVKKYSTSIIASNVTFLGSKSDGQPKPAQNNVGAEAKGFDSDSIPF